MTRRPRRPSRRALALVTAIGPWVVAATVTLLATAGCTTPQGEVSSAPIAVSTIGGLFALGGAPGATPGNLLIDTGTVLTASAEQTDKPRIVQGDVSLYDLPDGGDPVRRADFVDVPILHAPLSPVGLDDITQTFVAILGGDLLSRFSVALDYLHSTITLSRDEPSCSCELADACNAVLPFTLAGGGSIALGDQVHTFPATRVTLDACMEAIKDPVQAGVSCVVQASAGAPVVHQRGYEIDQPPGVDARLLVATGFGGMILGASLWDRLRGPGSAAALLAGPTVRLHFAVRSEGIKAARATLGDVARCADSRCTALVLVGREGLLGACGELARSRRLRWRAGHPATLQDANGKALVDAPPDCKRGDTDCDPMDGCLRCLDRVRSRACGDPNRCNDANQAAAPVIELGGPIDVFVVDDTAPILQEVNADVRPQLSDVEGIVGTELLKRLSLRIDYPNRRMIAHCSATSALDGSCGTIPRYVCYDKVNDCGPRGVDAERLCNAPSAFRGDQLCLPAPNP